MRIENQTARIVSLILLVLEVVLILAGPAFHLFQDTPALFADIICFVIAAAIRMFFKKT